MCEQPGPGDLRLVYADPRDLIVPPEHPRSDHDDYPVDSFQHPRHQLYRSVQQFGVLQPILARQTDAGLEIISGRRRRTAAIHAQLDRVPVLITDQPPADDLTLNLAENLARQPLNPIEQAHAFDQIGAARSARQFSLDPREVAESRSLLALDPYVQQLVADGHLSADAARELRHADPEYQPELAHRATVEPLDARDVFHQAPYYTNKIKAEREELKIHGEALIDAINDILEAKRARLVLRRAAPKGTIFVDLRSPEETFVFSRRLGGETVPDPPTPLRASPRTYRKDDPYRSPAWTATWQEVEARPNTNRIFHFEDLFLPDHSPRYGLPAPDEHANFLIDDSPFSSFPDPRQRLPPALSGAYDDDEIARAVRRGDAPYPFFSTGSYNARSPRTYEDDEDDYADNYPGGFFSAAQPAPPVPSRAVVVEVDYGSRYPTTDRGSRFYS